MRTPFFFFICMKRVVWREVSLFSSIKRFKILPSHPVLSPAQNMHISVPDHQINQTCPHFILLHRQDFERLNSTYIPHANKSYPILSMINNSIRLFKKRSIFSFPPEHKFPLLTTKNQNPATALQTKISPAFSNFRRNRRFGKRSSPPPRVLRLDQRPGSGWPGGNQIMRICSNTFLLN